MPALDVGAATAVLRPPNEAVEDVGDSGRALLSSELALPAAACGSRCNLRL